VLVMGLTFKENCPDLRNTRIVDIVAELKSYNCHVDVYDPWVIVGDAQREYGITPIVKANAGTYDAIILAVAHNQFKNMGAAAIRVLGKPTSVLYDLKYLLSAQETDLRL
jgi:UDP-N-acetyl-D-galactosamine dehydrogenase